MCGIFGFAGKESNKMPTSGEHKQLRSFGLIVGGIFAALGLWPFLWRGEALRLWALALAVGLVLPALVAPRCLKIPYRFWMALGQLLGWINTRIILGLMFFGIFTPVGLVFRLLGRDAMRRRFEPHAASYRVACQPRPSSHMTRQF